MLRLIIIKQPIGAILLEYRVFNNFANNKQEQFTRYQLFDAQERTMISATLAENSFIGGKTVTPQEALSYIRCMMRNDDCEK